MSDAKMHHYLPKTYLEGFADASSGLVNYYDRIRERFDGQAPANVAKERRLYAFQNEDGTYDNTGETILSRLEGEFPAFRLKAERGERLTPDDFDFAVQFCAASFSRVPPMMNALHRLNDDHAKHVLDHAYGSKDLVEKMWRAFRKEHPDVDLPLEELIERGPPQTGVLATKQYQLHQMGRMMMRVATALSHMKLTLLHAPSDRSFITCDRPMVAENPTGSPLPVAALGQIQFWMPISSRVGVFWITQDARLAPQANRKFAAHLNMMAAFNGYRLLLGDSMQSLKHLVGKHQLAKHKPWDSYDPRKISAAEM